MSPQTRQCRAGDELSGSILRVVDDPDRVESLRKMLSSFNHQCRNSLNGIKMSLYLFKREAGGPMPSRWLELERTYQELERLFDRLQVIYRPLALTRVRSPFGQLVNERFPTWRLWFELRGRSFELAPPPEDLPADFDPMYLGQALDAFIAWRAESRGGEVRAHLSWDVHDDVLEFSWRETRCAGDRPETEPPRSISKSHPTSSGQIDSLALPLLARIVAAHGGVLETSGESDFEARIQLPRIPKDDASA